jgi:ribonuclease J
MNTDEQMNDQNSEYALRFVPLGGVIGVTKNMYLYELYLNNKLKDILIVDCGIGFPQEKELGVDLVIPDISYLKDKTDKIRGIILTHGHEDHISALPYHYESLGSPPVYTTKLTRLLVLNKAKEHNVNLDITEIKYRKEYVMSEYKVRFLPMTHSIPDTMHVLINTPVGAFYHGQDFKLDLTPPYGEVPDFYGITRAGHEGVRCLLSDCLGSEKPGLAASENVVGQTFEDQMRKTKGKFIMTTFSSNISRVRQCVEAAIKFNRKVIFLGRSMRENTRLAQEIGYLPIPKTLQGKDTEVPHLPPNKICLIVPGSQGQYNSALSKIALKQNKMVKIKPGDKVVFSSDPIPGNENEVYAVIEELTVQGAEVVYSDVHDQLHATGHGHQEDMKFLARFTKPKHFIPIGGTIRHQRQYQILMQELGHKKDDVLLLDEGETVWFTKHDVKMGEAIDTKSIYVDAYGVGDVESVVLRDRQTLSSQGIIVAVVILDAHGKPVTPPKILSKGFTFEKHEEEIFDHATKAIESYLIPQRERVKDFIGLRNQIIRKLEDVFYKKGGKEPLIIVEVIQV